MATLAMVTDWFPIARTAAVEHDDAEASLARMHRRMLQWAVVLPVRQRAQQA